MRRLGRHVCHFRAGWGLDPMGGGNTQGCCRVGALEPVWITPRRLDLSLDATSLDYLRSTTAVPESGAFWGVGVMGVLLALAVGRV